MDTRSRKREINAFSESQGHTLRSGKKTIIAKSPQSSEERNDDGHVICLRNGKKQSHSPQKAERQLKRICRPKRRRGRFTGSYQEMGDIDDEDDDDYDSTDDSSDSLDEEKSEQSELCGQTQSSTSPVQNKANIQGSSIAVNQKRLKTWKKKMNKSTMTPNRGPFHTSDLTKEKIGTLDNNECGSTKMIQEEPDGCSLKEEIMQEGKDDETQDEMKQIEKGEKMEEIEQVGNADDLNEEMLEKGEDDIDKEIRQMVKDREKEGMKQIGKGSKYSKEMEMTGKGKDDTVKEIKQMGKKGDKEEAQRAGNALTIESVKPDGAVEHMSAVQVKETSVNTLSEQVQEDLKALPSKCRKRKSIREISKVTDSATSKEEESMKRIQTEKKEVETNDEMLPPEDNSIVLQDGHLTTKYFSNGIRCPKCPKVCATVQKFNNHLRTHEDKKTECPECHLLFRRQTSLDVHMRRHTQSKPYKCHLCTATFRHDSSLSIHLRTHRNERNYKCPKCPKAFLSITCVRKHMKRRCFRGELGCVKCGEGFKSKEELKRHIYEIHDDGKPKQVAVKTFVCYVCAQLYRTRDSLYRHQAKMHNMPRPWACTQCNDRFPDRDSTIEHLMDTHKHSKEEADKFAVDRVKQEKEIKLRKKESEKKFQEAAKHLWLEKRVENRAEITIVNDSNKITVTGKHGLTPEHLDTFLDILKPKIIRKSLPNDAPLVDKVMAKYPILMPRPVVVSDSSQACSIGVTSPSSTVTVEPFIPTVASSELVPTSFTASQPSVTVPDFIDTAENMEKNDSLERPTSDVLEVNESEADTSGMCNKINEASTRELIVSTTMPIVTQNATQESPIQRPSDAQCSQVSTTISAVPYTLSVAPVTVTSVSLSLPLSSTCGVTQSSRREGSTSAIKTSRIVPAVSQTCNAKAPIPPTVTTMSVDPVTVTSVSLSSPLPFPCGGTQSNISETSISVVEVSRIVPAVSLTCNLNASILPTVTALSVAPINVSSVSLSSPLPSTCGATQSRRSESLMSVVKASRILPAVSRSCSVEASIPPTETQTSVPVASDSTPPILPHTPVLCVSDAGTSASKTQSVQDVDKVCSGSVALATSSETPSDDKLSPSTAPDPLSSQGTSDGEFVLKLVINANGDCQIQPPVMTEDQLAATIGAVNHLKTVANKVMLQTKLKMKKHALQNAKFKLNHWSCNVATSGDDSSVSLESVASNIAKEIATTKTLLAETNRRIALIEGRQIRGNERGKVKEQDLSFITTTDKLVPRPETFTRVEGAGCTNEIHSKSRKTRGKPKKETNNASKRAVKQKPPTVTQAVSPPKEVQDLLSKLPALKPKPIVSLVACSVVGTAHIAVLNQAGIQIDGRMNFIPAINPPVTYLSNYRDPSKDKEKPLLLVQTKDPNVCSTVSSRSNLRVYTPRAPVVVGDQNAPFSPTSARVSSTVNSTIVNEKVNGAQSDSSEVEEPTISSCNQVNSQVSETKEKSPELATEEKFSLQDIVSHITQPKAAEVAPNDHDVVLESYTTADTSLLEEETLVATENVMSTEKQMKEICSDVSTMSLEETSAGKVLTEATVELMRKRLSERTRNFSDDMKNTTAKTIVVGSQKPEHEPGKILESIRKRLSEQSLLSKVQELNREALLKSHGKKLVGQPKPPGKEASVSNNKIQELNPKPSEVPTQVAQHSVTKFTAPVRVVMSNPNQPNWLGKETSTSKNKVQEIANELHSKPIEVLTQAVQVSSTRFTAPACVVISNPNQPKRLRKEAFTSQKKVQETVKKKRRKGKEVLPQVAQQSVTNLTDSTRGLKRNLNPDQDMNEDISSKKRKKTIRRNSTVMNAGYIPLSQMRPLLPKPTGDVAGNFPGAIASIYWPANHVPKIISVCSLTSVDSGKEAGIGEEVSTDRLNRGSCEGDALPAETTIPGNHTAGTGGEQVTGSSQVSGARESPWVDKEGCIASGIPFANEANVYAPTQLGTGIADSYDNIDGSPNIHPVKSSWADKGGRKVSGIPFGNRYVATQLESGTANYSNNTDVTPNGHAVESSCRPFVNEASCHTPTNLGTETANSPDIGGSLNGNDVKLSRADKAGSNESSRPLGNDASRYVSTHLVTGSANSFYNDVSPNGNDVKIEPGAEEIVDAHQQQSEGTSKTYYTSVHSVSPSEHSHTDKYAIGNNHVTVSPSRRPMDCQGEPGLVSPAKKTKPNSPWMFKLPPQIQSDTVKPLSPQYSASSFLRDMCRVTNSMGVTLPGAPTLGTQMQRERSPTTRQRFEMRYHQQRSPQQNLTNQMFLTESHGTRDTSTLTSHSSQLGCDQQSPRSIQQEQQNSTDQRFITRPYGANGTSSHSEYYQQAPRTVQQEQQSSNDQRFLTVSHSTTRKSTLPSHSSQLGYDQRSPRSILQQAQQNATHQRSVTGSHGTTCKSALPSYSSHSGYDQQSPRSVQHAQQNATDQRLFAEPHGTREYPQPDYRGVTTDTEGYTQIYSDRSVQYIHTNGQTGVYPHHYNTYNIQAGHQLSPQSRLNPRGTVDKHRKQLEQDFHPGFSRDIGANWGYRPRFSNVYQGHPSRNLTSHHLHQLMLNVDDTLRNHDISHERGNVLRSTAEDDRCDNVSEDLRRSSGHGGQLRGSHNPGITAKDSDTIAVAPEPIMENLNPTEDEDGCNGVIKRETVDEGDTPCLSLRPIILEVEAEMEKSRTDCHMGPYLQHRNDVSVGIKRELDP